MLRRAPVLSAAVLIAVAAAAPGAARAQQAGRLDGALAAVADEVDARGEGAAEERARQRGLEVDRGPGGPRVVAMVETATGSSAAVSDADLRAAGVEVLAASRDFIRVRAPVRRLRALAAVRGVRIARAPARPKAFEGRGSPVSESVGLTGAGALQAGSPAITGAGVRVAIVDLGFIGASARIAEGNLGADTVIVPLPGQTASSVQTGTAHGAGVAEHTADMAPGARLYLLKTDDEVDLQNAADYIAANGIRVANHSVGWVNSSYYDDTGAINAIFQESRYADGTFWTVASGNDALSHWRGTWTDADGDAWLDFAGADEGLDLTSASASAVLFLNWNQYPPARPSLTDLDLYVYNRNGSIVARSEAVQTGTQEPTEAVSFAYSGSAAPYRVQIRRYSGPTAGLDMTIFSFNNDLQYPVAAASLMDPSNSSAVFSVGAIDYRDWTLPSPPPEPYSSQGPTTDGRAKPDIASPDGTSSVSYGAGGSYGTSFSAPTVAGAAALLLAQDPTLTADELAEALASRAQDVGAPGPDFVYGAGKLSVGLLSPNAAPTAVADSGACAEDASATIAATANDVDPDGDPLSVASVTQPAIGSASFSAGSVTYTPPANWSGEAAFSYTVSDGKGGTSSAAVSVVVSPVPDAPLAGADAATTPLDAAVTVAVLANDSDADGDAISLASVGAASSGAAAANADGTVTYTPSPGFTGTDAFTYVVTDGALSATGTVAITVLPANRPPSAASDAATTNHDVTVTVNVRANDADPDGDPLAIAGFTQGARGAVSASGGSLVYNPDAGFIGVDSFGYTVSDGKGGEASATVTITVRGVRVADLDGSRVSAGKKWTATARVFVTDATGAPQTAATVRGRWNGGSLVTLASAGGGWYQVSKSGIPNGTPSIAFTVASVASAGLPYVPAANGDPDGDSSPAGTTIVILKP